MHKPLNIVWMRRDLRLYDHAALHEALQSDAHVQPVFVFDTEILERFSNKQDRRLSFLAHTLCAMHQQLQTQHGGIVVVHGKATQLIPKLAAVLGAAQVMSEEDYEPSTRARDEHVRRSLAAGQRLVQVTDHVIMPPEKILKDDGTPYKVFTPYSKKWRQAVDTQSFAEKPVSLEGRMAQYDVILKQLQDAQITFIDPAKGAEAMLAEIGYEATDLGQWEPSNARQRLSRFVQDKADQYHDRRDILADDGTSRLSPYLRFGLVSIREAARLIQGRSGKGFDTWLNELIWREFYQQIYYHFPHAETSAFNEKYRELTWEHEVQKITAWKEGKTGFPVIDAAMRQLLEEGWMHNRARMIVASFATKDLHMDWRIGEEHFAQHLMDYEMASNNGGWQWAASTGTDAQPYFRVFNPELQSKKFDPDGTYIRRYVPELRDVDTKRIHAPYAKADMFDALRYPAPIVDHATEKDKAIRRFKEV